MSANSEEKITRSEDRTLKDLSPNTAALLCYVAGWISGIVFLILEQKDRFVRFHALQSIIVFGVLAVAAMILGYIPFVGTAFSAIIGVTGFILWIILMVKAYSGEIFKIPWAGDLAEKLTAQSMPPAGNTNAARDVSAAPPVYPTARDARREAFRAKYYSTGARTGRIVGSAFAIAFSLALVIFLNFFNRYIAYYEPSYIGGVTYWQVHTLVTPEFYSWLPVVTTTLVLTIIGHAILISFDKFLLREIVEIILAVVSLAAVVSLLVTFPFHFSVIPNENAAYWIPVGLTITLIFVAIGLGIGALVRFIQLIVHAAEGRY
jgi:uncharacterized membrane protein